MSRPLTDPVAGWVGPKPRQIVRPSGGSYQRADAEGFYAIGISRGLSVHEITDPVVRNNALDALRNSDWHRTTGLLKLPNKADAHIISPASVQTNTHSNIDGQVGLYRAYSRLAEPEECLQQVPPCEPWW